MRISIKVGNELMFADNIKPIDLSVSSVRPKGTKKAEETKAKEKVETFSSALSEEKLKLKAEGSAATAQKVATTADDYESIAGDLAPIFKKAADTYGLDQKLLELVGFHESAFKADATSKHGAMGIMQLMPYTAEYLGVSNPYDPEENIMGGAKLLKEYYDEFDGNLDYMLAGYSAGGSAVKKYGGVPPYSETVNYINWIHERYP